jgi:hypothetical protein
MSPCGCTPNVQRVMRSVRCAVIAETS